MGNQISAVGLKKYALPIGGKERPASQASTEDALSEQETLRAPSTSKSRFSKLKASISRATSSHNAPSPVPSDAPSVQSRKQFLSTDGASTPKDEVFKITLPTPSLMADEHYSSLSLDAVSPSNASTITQGILDAPNSPASRSPTPTPSLLALSGPSSSSTPTPLSQARPTSDTSSLWPHPYFPLKYFRLDEIPPAPLRPVHWACYQSHQRMLRSQNANHPVPCMTCRVGDDQVRWKCVWCCLRICGECMERLNKTERRDLKILMQENESAVDRREILA